MTPDPITNMRSDSVAYVVAGICFGVILGWIIGTQQARRPGQAVAVQSATGQAGQSTGAVQSQAPPLDQGRVQSLQTILASDPQNVNAAIQLGNTYFDAEQWPEAITWYERAVELDPKNPDASTDLGVAYYYSNRPDQALEQFEHSLSVDPRHTKTLLNKGIVLAFGKQDLNAAAAEWQKVVDLAPDSPEGQAARRALDGVASAHAGGATPASP
jgi:cytochrome c-type biogenesis protein CcmH/NrfG